MMWCLSQAAPSGLTGRIVKERIVEEGYDFQ